jgi:predicted dithiol-disulfide oxidoreductase (DUF899 family)
MPELNPMPVAQMVRENGARFPNESPEYRAARDALLAEEIELRRRIERVAEQRRALPPGGEVTGDYRFEGENGPTDFAGLFGDRDTLVVYSWMFGPDWDRPCPMCTTLLDGWDGQTPSLRRRTAFAVIGRAPLPRQLAFARERGWRFLPLYADLNDAFSRDYHGVSPEGDDIPGFHVFTRRDGVIRHFWSGEMGGVTADPGQDPRGAPDLMSLWTILDATPEGRGADFYPKLDDRAARA